MPQQVSQRLQLFLSLRTLYPQLCLVTMDFRHFRVQRICRDFYHPSNIPRPSRLAPQISEREKQRERSKEKKRRAKQRLREERFAERAKEHPIPRTPRTHAGKHGKN